MPSPNIDSTSFKLLLVGGHPLFAECIDTGFGDKNGIHVERVQNLSKDHCSKVAGGFDLVVIDFQIGKPNALALTAELTRTSPGVKVLILGLTATEASLTEFVEAGCKGYLQPDVSFGEISAAIDCAVRGGTVCSPTAAFWMFSRLTELASQQKFELRLKCPDLTFRQLEILTLAAEGLTNKGIADQLFLSVPTVKNHLRRVFQVLGVRNRSEAVELACRRGWL